MSEERIVRKRKSKKEKRFARSIRLTNTYRDLIEAKYGTVQRWFDENLRAEFGEVRAAEITQKEEQEEITEDDF